MNRIMTLSLGLGMLAGMGTFAFGQDGQQNTAPGWHRFGEQRNGDSSSVPQAPPPQDRQQDRFQGPPPDGQEQRDQARERSYAPPPSSLTVPAGTWITVRVNQPLSSDRNQPGDAFTATLLEPIVTQGFVVARRGQTVGGRVSQAEKAGRVKGTSSLGVELTELSLVDGQQIPLKTHFIERRGDTSVGSDVGAVAVTSGLGAAIGAAAGGGWGAGIGALAGAAVGTTGVLSTRGRGTVIYPETALTFRLEQPLTITSQSMQAFQPAGQEDYSRPMLRSSQPPPSYRSPYGSAPYGGAPYAVAPYPYYPSGGFYFYSGPRYSYGRGYYGRRW